MGDRCSVEITARTQDREVIIEVMGDANYEDTPDNGTTTLTFDQCNYGAADALAALAADGIVFRSNTGAGDAYGAGKQCSPGDGYLYWVESCAGEDGGGTIAVEVMPNGEPDPAALAQVREFCWCDALAASLMAGTTL